MKKSIIKKSETVPVACFILGLLVGSIASLVLDNIMMYPIGLGIGSFIGLIYIFCQKLKRTRNEKFEKEGNCDKKYWK